MSPHAMSNFVTDLVEMAKATERLPIVEANLESARNDIQGYLATIQRLELKLMDRAAEIETLQAAVRSAEVSRDDAELRFLEADDIANRVHRKVADAEALLRSMAADLEGLKPAKAPEAYEAPPQGQSEANPPAPPAPASDGPTDAPSVPAQLEAATTTGTEGEGVSVSVDPIEAPAAGTGIGMEPVRPSSEPGGPYANKLYIRVPGWISRSDWLAGGGTAEAYDWREGQAYPEGLATNAA